MMKYELMRAGYCNKTNSFMLDLYNMHYDKCVELHYNTSYEKYDIESVKPILEHKMAARELHTIEYWDNLIKLRKDLKNE